MFYFRYSPCGLARHENGWTATCRADGCATDLGHNVHFLMQVSFFSTLRGVDVQNLAKTENVCKVYDLYLHPSGVAKSSTSLNWLG